MDPSSLAMHQLLHRSHSAQRPAGLVWMGRLRGPWRRGRGLSPAHWALDLARAEKNGFRWALGSGSDSHMCIPWASWSHAVDPWVSRLEKLLMDRSPGSTRRCLGGYV